MLIGDAARRVLPGAGIHSDLASTRLRSLIPGEWLSRHVPVWVIPTHMLALDDALSRFGRAGAVVIGKLSTGALREHPEEARRLLGWLRRMAGSVPLYADLSDDYGEWAVALDNPFLLEYQRELGRHCTFVVPTRQLAASLEPYARHGVAVVEDPYESPAAQAVRTTPSELLRLGWFGTLGKLTAPALESALQQIARSLPAGLAAAIEIVSDEAGRGVFAPIQERVQKLSAALRFEYTLWSIKATAAAVNRADFVLLPQDHRAAWGRVKSHNRLVETIRGGRLALASPIPAYAELSAYAWVGEDLGEGLSWALEHPVEAADRVARGQAYVESRFSPDAIGRKWADVLGIAHDSQAEATLQPVAGAWSRSKPSPRLLARQALYRRVHETGMREYGLAPAATFPGNSLMRHLHAVRLMAVATGARTMLDYGAGKGVQYRPQNIVIDGRHVADGVAEYWEADDVACYDPGYAPFADLPPGPFDGVISVDVLQHCPEEDLPWILDEIFGLARRFVFAVVASFPAMKNLPDGEPSHVTVRPAAWWSEMFGRAAARAPNVSWELLVVDAVDGRTVDTPFRGGPACGPAATISRPAAAADSRGQEASAIESVDFDGRTLRFHAPDEAVRRRAHALAGLDRMVLDWLRAMPADADFLDVGAGFGVCTLVAAVCRGARVCAFEPDSRDYALLNANIELNGQGYAATALCLSLGNEQAVTRVRAQGASTFQQSCLSSRLDDLVAARTLPQPAYARISVGGDEHKVLRGMAAVLRDARLRSISVRLDTSAGEHIEVRAWMEALGFRWDPAQVMRTVLTSGPREGVAEHVFLR